MSLKTLSLLILCLVNLCGRAAEPAPGILCVTWNAENLFDVDAVSIYSDFPVTGTSVHRWTPEKLAHKLTKLTTLLQQVEPGRLPDVVAIAELEADHTPETTETPAAFIARTSGKNYRELLQGTLPAELAGVPIECWILKALTDDGLAGYQLIVGDVLNLQKEAIRNGILTRLPVVATKQHHVAEARTILEAELSTPQGNLFVFANHWKSGASSLETELIRLGNADVLRKRLDELLAQDTMVPFIIMGDLNAHYNQKERYPQMARTAMQDGLHSQGSVDKFGENTGPDLFNLWYELPASARYSDFYRGEWGTLMHMIISRGLADGKGLDYELGTFRAVKIPGLTTHGVLNLPWRHTNMAQGAGLSDHLPLAANFRLSDRANATRGILKTGAEDVQGPLVIVPTKFDRATLPKATTLLTLTDEQMAERLGEVFILEGKFIAGRKPAVEINGRKFALYLPTPAVTEKVKGLKTGQAIRWIGELNFYREALEFEISQADWAENIK